MRPARALTAALLALGLALPAQAQAPARVVSAGPEKTAIAIYQDPAAQSEDFTDYESYWFDGETGLASVTEWRTIDLPAGESVIRFEGVAEGIVPQTAAIDGLPARLVERNHDFDLMSPGSLIAKSVGDRVTRVRTDRVTGKEVREQAILRSGPDGVVLDFDGRIEALDCAGGPERLVFERLPPELSDRPTLSLRVRADTAGRHRVRLSYMTVGVLWAANYVAKLNEDGTLDLTGWITIRNDGRTGFSDALTQVVAGDVERDADTVATVAEVTPTAQRCWPMDTTTRSPPRMLFAPPVSKDEVQPGGDVSALVVTGSRIKRSEFNSAAPIEVMSQEALVSNLGDYKLYTLPFATTVDANQTKQLLMLQRNGVKYERVYVYRIYPGDSYEPEEAIQPATILFRTRNKAANNLGLSLPGGQMKVMARDQKDRPLLVGDGRFRNTGLGAPLEFDIGETVEVEVIPRLVTQEALNDTGRRDTYEVSVINHRAVPSRFELRLNSWAKFKVSHATPRFQMKPAGAVWDLKLKPGETRVIRYQVTTFD
ncbi:hypothetical protein [Caulobacter sp. NIBR1757]|uniref:DUF4139 domain-containing protein n=1 Tax=Caulobacter sp. NIBR1757 TaxID=3016000 RepID=UPI0022F042C7|nr:hypothetical protein [Caulobacter sp. NIBR1757]WGM39601.1 hypothetical protein AMEJIAPC_02526 [Caulobacter sp. NIBR1757]